MVGQKRIVLLYYQRFKHGLIYHAQEQTIIFVKNKSLRKRNRENSDNSVNQYFFISLKFEQGQIIFALRLY